MEAAPHAVTRSSTECPEQVVSSCSARGPYTKRDDRWVIFVPFDDPFRPILADRTLLEHYGCRSAALFKHQPPDCEVQGRPAWNCYMSRVVLVAFLKSLTVGEFHYPRDVDEHEVARVFEYEGIAMPGNAILPSVPSIEVPLPTLGQRARSDAQTSRLSTHVAQIVHGLLEWPRLADGISEADLGNDPGFSCTGSRVWLAFAPRVVVPQWPGGDETYQLAKRRYTWLVSQLQAVGYVHYRMAQAGLLDKEARDEQSFVTLARQGVEIDPSHYYLSCKRDLPRRMRDEHRAMIRHSDHFAVWVCNTVTDHGTDEGQSMPERVKYARVCVKLVTEMIGTAPNLSRLFGGQCTDSNKLNHVGGCGPGKVESTPERAALAKALKAHGLKVLSWSDAAPPQVTPLVFPPAYRQLTNPPSPYVLLERE